MARSRMYLYVVPAFRAAGELWRTGTDHRMGTALAGDGAPAPMAAGRRPPDRDPLGIQCPRNLPNTRSKPNAFSRRLAAQGMR